MSIKLFHTADIHIGLPFSKHKSVKKELEQARYDTLEKMVQTANEEGCQIFVIAGDLFDTTSVPRYAVIHTAEILKSFEGPHLLIMPGNHDYKDYGPTSNWQLFQNQNFNNLTLLEEERVEHLEINSQKIEIYPAPCDKKHSAENKLTYIKDLKKSNDAIKIGIAHGALEGLSPDFEKKYYPMQKAELNKADVDLWLLGHTHIAYPLNPDKHDKIFMPGTPEPDGFDCNHEGTAWLFEFDKNKKFTSKQISTGTLRFHNKEYQINSEQDLSFLGQDLTDIKNESNLIKLKVSGRISNEVRKKWQTLRAELEKETLLLIVREDELVDLITKEHVEKEYAEGSFPSLLLSNFLDQDSRALQKAYELIQEASE